MYSLIALSQNRKLLIFVVFVEGSLYPHQAFFVTVLT